MKSELNRELVESLNESNNEEFISNMNEVINDLVSRAVADISQKSPFVKVEKCSLVPANEICTASMTQLSKFTYFLGIDNPQIEQNSKNKKNFWKFVWREFRASLRLGRKKYKKRKHQDPETSVKVAELGKYSIADFRHDFVYALAGYISENSYINEYQDHIEVFGKEDFGTNVCIKIYVTSFDMKNQTYKLYKQNKNKFFEVNFHKRYENLQNKNEQTNSMFVNMIKIFNAIFCKRYNMVPNQILVESLLYTCPNVLFEEDVYKTFVNVANYIRITDASSFLSVCDQAKNIFHEPLIIGANAQTQFGKIISMLDVFKF